MTKRLKNISLLYWSMVKESHIESHFLPSSFFSFQNKFQININAMNKTVSIIRKVFINVKRENIRALKIYVIYYLYKQR